MAKHRRRDDNDKPLTKKQRRNANEDTARHPHLKKALDDLAAIDKKDRAAKARALYHARRRAKVAEMSLSKAIRLFGKKK
jgi:hypothetical protein